MKLWTPEAFLARINRLTCIVNGKVDVRENADDLKPSEVEPVITDPSFGWNVEVDAVVEGPCSEMEIEGRQIARSLVADLKGSSDTLGKIPTKVLVYATCCGDYGKRDGFELGGNSPLTFREELELNAKHITWMFPSMPDLGTCFLRRNSPTRDGVTALLEAKIIKLV